MDRPAKILNFRERTDSEGVPEDKTLGRKARLEEIV